MGQFNLNPRERLTGSLRNVAVPFRSIYFEIQKKCYSAPCRQINVPAKMGRCLARPLKTLQLFLSFLVVKFILLFTFWVQN